MIWVVINVVLIVVSAWLNSRSYERGKHDGFHAGMRDGLMIGELRANNRVRASIYRD
jgi:hypothetical protein